jgi:hypothetical protein
MTHAFLWEYRYKRLKSAQLLGQLGDFLTFWWVPVEAIDIDFADVRRFHVADKLGKCCVVPLAGHTAHL